ncbi:MAG: GGDEF domain-containing protein [Pseudomonadota bacterium]
METVSKEVKGKLRLFGSPTLGELLIILFSAITVTVIMSYLDAFERLYLFTNIHKLFRFDEFAVFLPAFLAMGFVIFAVRRIQELESEISRRHKVEEALLDTQKRYWQLSITDGLTNLYNSRHFYDKLEEEIDRATRYAHPLSILMLDIDSFKKFNDKYGHLEGDKVLVWTGEAIKECLRRTDSAYRYGGEEFTVILPVTHSPGAAVVAERIRERFQAQAFFPKPNEAAHVTMSIGVAQYVPKEEKEAVIKRADQNLYKAKELGKNKVFFQDRSGE